MEININEMSFYEDNATKVLVEYIKENENELNLEESQIYYKFPIIKEMDQEIKFPKLCIVSKVHGIVIIDTSDKVEREILELDFEESDNKLGQIYSSIYSKLFKVKALKANRNSLKFLISTIAFFPEAKKKSDEYESHIIKSLSEFKNIMSNIKNEEYLSDETFKLLISNIEGAVGIIKPKEREIENLDIKGKGRSLIELEREISSLDTKQRIAALTQIDGPQRIRGLAGSGKTIILCMKVANILMKEPNAKILYTFYTKSLYDYIKLLITRFYRIYSEQDPDFNDAIHIRHSWGGEKSIWCLL